MPKKANKYQKNLINYPDIKSAYDRVLSQKNFYENNLCGKNILYLYLDAKTQDISAKKTLFLAEHYLHLTGLDYRSLQYNKRVLGKNVSTNALNFYQRLGNDDDLLKDISFIVGADAQQTKLFFDYTQRKLDNLSQLTSIAKKAEYIGKYKGNQDFDIIINRNNSSIAFKHDLQNQNILIPISSLNATAQQIATDIQPIIAIFIKEHNDLTYKIQYLNKKIDVSRRRFSSELTDMLSFSSFENTKEVFNSNRLLEIKKTFEVSYREQISSIVEELYNSRTDALSSSKFSMMYSTIIDSHISKLNCVEKCDIFKSILQDEYDKLANDDSLPINEDMAIVLDDKIKDIEQKRHLLSVADSVGGSGTVPLSSQINKMTISADGTVTASPAIGIKLPSIRELANKAINGIKSALDKINAQKEAAATKEKSPRSSAKPAPKKKNVSHDETTFPAATPQHPEQRPGQQTPPKQAEQAVQKTTEPKTVHSGYTIMSRAQRAAKMIEARKKAEAAQQLGDNQSAPKKNNQSL